MASHCFRSSYLDRVTFLRNPWKGITLTVDRFWWHLSIRQRRTLTNIGGHRPPSLLPAFHRSLPSVQPGATQFLCALEMSNSGSTRKKEAYQLSLKSKQRKNSRLEERTGILFTACIVHFMFRALFGVPHLFAR